MTQPHEIHQIEYRWEHQQDLVPIASSMSPHEKQGWNALITSWVRHPDAEVTPESVRYQLLPDGRAVLAWRYRDPEVAKREDGTHGRPIVSRVFVAQQDLLTPDIAIVLCRTGMPESAGPRPGEVVHGDVLPWLAVQELRNLAEIWAETMDREAAIDSGLAELLTVTLAEPELPLAIQLRSPYLCEPPGSGPQPRLLWGMWRIGRPLLGDDGRGWSFSTFEAPLGDSDPARLPDIVFRLDQPFHHAPARARTERRVSPYNPGTPASLERYPEMAAWLVEEYRIRGGESLGGKLAECGPGASRGERFDTAYDWLRAVRRLPPMGAADWEQSLAGSTASGEPEPQPDQRPRMGSETRELDEQPERYELAGQDGYGDRDEAGPAFVLREPEQEAPAEPRDARRRYGLTEYQPLSSDPVKYTLAGYYAAQAAAGRQPAASPPANPPADEEPPPSVFGRPGEVLETEPGARQVPQPEFRPRSDVRHVSTVSELLRMLTTAGDVQEFESVLQRIRTPSVEFSQSDRRQAFREMQGNSWYIPYLLHYDYLPCEDELAAIFRKILLPDIGLEQVQRQMAQWILEAGPEHTTRTLIRALLLAPPGDDARRRMRSLLRPALAVRLIVDYDSTDLWPSEPDRRESDSGGSATPGLRRFLRGGGRD